MTLPPGHYGKAGKELDKLPRSAAPPVAPLSWRWFLPRSRRRRTVAAALAALLAALLAPGGMSAVVLVGGFGLFHVLVLGVALRRVVPMGRIWRRDPAGSAYLVDERSHMYAVSGVVLVAGALAAASVVAISDLISR